MNSKNTWPFDNKKHVHGMPLPEYLTWASGGGQHEKKLLLPPIQRGFVWKPKQIVDLWDSLFRGMPIGSLMLSNLSSGQEGIDLSTKETKSDFDEAIGLLDGQQRTLAMLIGWPSTSSSQHCLWIDLAEEGHAGSPFEIRLTTQAQPFGFQRISQSRLSRHERREARKLYDSEMSDASDHSKRDYELFATEEERKKPRPWKAGKTGVFIKVKDAWSAFIDSKQNKADFLDVLSSGLQTPRTETMLSRLYDSFTRITELEVPLILIPEHISASRPESLPSNGPDPLVLLFERVGRNGASLSVEDLLFSMIKQQWPKAQELINQSQERLSVRAFMGAADYVMTAFRLAAAEKNITDTPHPNPNDFHRHLGTILGKDGEKDRPLRNYIESDGNLTSAFDTLYDALLYRGDQDTGLPLLMMPHLSRGLIQLLLCWIMRNAKPKLNEVNRQKVISFSLYWFLHVWYEDKASKVAFEIINSTESDSFPSEEIYAALTAAPGDEIGFALPFMPCDEMKDVLTQEASASMRTHNDIFKSIANVKQRELYKRFCWGRKPILLWLQRRYVQLKFGEQTVAEYAGLTDEESVPYDYDHLCPQSHWGTDWRNIIQIPNVLDTVMSDFKHGRNGVGNCIGNLHVLESSLNRSLGDAALASKLKFVDWRHQDSLLYHVPEHDSLWLKASPDVDDKACRTWDETRLQNFQEAIYTRALGLYGQYVEACEHILPKCTSE